MSVRWNPPDGLADEFNRIYDRLRKIETSMSKRILPVGYRWTVGSNGELIVVRESDDAQSTVIS